MLELTDMQLSILAHEDIAGLPLYPMPLGFRLVGAVDAGALAAAFEHVVSRHAALSATYDFGSGTACPVPAERLPKLSIRPQGTYGELVRVWHDGFDLDRQAPVRGALVRSATGAHLALGIHHVAGDAWSWDLVLRDLGRAYTAVTGGRPLPDGRAPSPFDVELAPSTTPADIGWWREALAGCAPPPDDGGDDRAHRYDLDLDARHTVAVRRTAATAGTSLAAVLTTAVSRAIAGREGSESTIGLATALRDTAARRQVVGPLLTILPVTTRWLPSAPARELVRAHAEAIGRSLEHREVPYPEIMRAAPGGRVPFRHVVNVVGDPPRLTLCGTRVSAIPVVQRWAVWPALWDFSVPTVGNIRGRLTTSGSCSAERARELALMLPAVLLDLAG